MLPEGWRRSTLGQIARITSGGTPARAEPSYWGGSIPWVTTGEIEFNTITDTAEKITEVGRKNSSAKLFPPGTLLLAMYGQRKTRGQVAKLWIEATTNQNPAAILLDDGHDPDFYFQFLSWQYDSIRDFGHSGGVFQFIYSKLDFLNGAFGCIPEHLDGFESTLDLPAFDFNLERASPRWLLHHVGREEFYRGQLGLASGGRKARRVSPSDLLRVEILLPDLREQRAIADAIETACAEERNLEKQVSALRAQKSVLMADLLTGKRRVHDSGADMERRSLATAG